MWTIAGIMKGRRRDHKQSKSQSRQAHSNRNRLRFGSWMLIPRHHRHSRGWGRQVQLTRFSLHMISILMASAAMCVCLCVCVPCSERRILQINTGSKRMHVCKNLLVHFSPCLWCKRPLRLGSWNKKWPRLYVYDASCVLCSIKSSQIFVANILVCIMSGRFDLGFPVLPQWLPLPF